MTRTTPLSVVVLVVVSTSACAIEPKKQRLFEDDTQPPRTATRDWAGEAITIDNAGLDPEDELEGVQVITSAAAKRISVEALLAARADVDKENNAEQALADVAASLVIEETPTHFVVRCGKGMTHGTARAQHSGCGTLRVTIPASTAERPHALVVRTGSGPIRIGTGDAASGDEAPFVRSLVVENKGPSTVDVRARPVKEATVSVVGHRDLTVALPEAFSSRKVVFGVASAPPNVDGVVVADFAGMVSGASYPPTGPSPDAITSLEVHAAGPPQPATIRISKL
jgi:hypothetical protein